MVSPNAEDVRIVQEGIDLLRSDYRVEWKKSVSGSFWPAYDQRVYDAISVALERMVGTDKDYLSAIGALRGKPIVSVSRSELATWLTYVVRGERFSDGHIEVFIRDGSLQAMLERALELAGAPAGE